MIAPQIRDDRAKWCIIAQHHGLAPEEIDNVTHCVEHKIYAQAHTWDEVRKRIHRLDLFQTTTANTRYAPATNLTIKNRLYTRMAACAHKLHKAVLRSSSESYFVELRLKARMIATQIERPRGIHFDTISRITGEWQRTISPECKDYIANYLSLCDTRKVKDLLTFFKKEYLCAEHAERLSVSPVRSALFTCGTILCSSFAELGVPPIFFGSTDLMQPLILFLIHSSIATACTTYLLHTSFKHASIINHQSECWKNMMHNLYTLTKEEQEKRQNLA